MDAFLSQPALRTFAILLAACGALGCSGAAPGSSTPFDDVLACGAAQFVACDVLEPACQQRGDQLDVYELDAGGVAGRWQLRFDSAALASSFAKLMAHNPNVSVRHQGEAVACVVSTTEHRPEWLFGPLGAI